MGWECSFLLMRDDFVFPNISGGYPVIRNKMRAPQIMDDADLFGVAP